MKLRFLIKILDHHFAAWVKAGPCAGFKGCASTASLIARARGPKRKEVQDSKAAPLPAFVDGPQRSGAKEKRAAATNWGRHDTYSKLVFKPLGLHQRS
jgi:hypothetical protein